MDLSAQELESLFGAAPQWTTALAELIAGAWSALLGCEVRATALASATTDQNSKPSELAFRAELTIDDCQHPLRWDVDRALAAALIDVQLGADEVAPARTHRVLTQIEQALVLRALEVSRLSFNSRPVDEHPARRLGEIVPTASATPDAGISVVPSATALTFHIQLLGVTGRFTWWLHSEHHQQLAPAEPQVPRRYTAVLAEFTLPESELMELAIGDIITTDTDADAPIMLYDEAGTAQSVTLGRLGDHKAVQLL